MNQFTTLTQKLHKTMREDFVSVSKKKNPVYLQLNRLTSKHLTYILGQYSIFPRKIVHMLLLSRERAEKENYPDIAKEITRNIGEELGTQTQGISHYNMLIKGIKRTLKTDLLHTKPSLSTETFIQTMLQLLKNERNYTVFGATYALESSAVPELEIVLDLVKKLNEHQNGATEINGILKDFFDRHLYIWEPGHEQELKEAISHYDLTPEQRNDFAKGFKATLRRMDTWWKGLSKEMVN